MRWRLLGLIMTAAGPDFTRAPTDGSLVKSPWSRPHCGRRRVPRAHALAPRPQPGIRQCRRQPGGWATDRRQRQLLEVKIDRWHNPGGRPFARYPFGVSVQAETRFNGVTIPSSFRPGWRWDGARQAAGEFFL